MLRLTMRRFQGWGQAAAGGGAAAAGGGGWGGGGGDAGVGGGGGGWGQSNAQAPQGEGDKTWGGGGGGGGWGGQAAAQPAAGAAGGWGASAAPQAAAGGAWGSQASSDAGGFEYRKLTPPMLLEVVKGEPGETHEYYAKMYFGPGSENSVKHNLWTFLKKFGHVTMERSSSGEAPRWYPINFKAKPPKVKIYDSDEWDLSVLPEHQVKNPSKAAIIAEQRRLQAAETGGAWGAGGGDLAKSTWGGKSGAVDPEWAAAAAVASTPSAGAWGAPSSGNDQAGVSWGAAAADGGSAGGWGQDTVAATATDASSTPDASATSGDRYGDADTIATTDTTAASSTTTDTNTDSATADAASASTDDSSAAAASSEDVSTPPAAEVEAAPVAPPAPVGPLSLKDQIYQIVAQNPGQPMHDYIDLLEKTSDKANAPSLFRELRTGGSLTRRGLEAGGFVWQPVTQHQQYY